MPLTREQLDAWFTDHPPTTDEQAAEALYNTWVSERGWVPWAPGGNSDAQDRARALAVGKGTAQKYQALLRRQQNAVCSITQGFYENIMGQPLRNLISDECESFAILINDLAPDGADKGAAIEHVRLACRALHEAATAGGYSQTVLMDIGAVEMMRARWAAIYAVTCGAAAPVPAPAPAPVREVA